MGTTSRGGGKVSRGAAALALGACLQVCLARAEDPPAARAGPKVSSRGIDVGGVTRTFHQRLPSAYDGKAVLPAVIVLHGGFGSGRQLVTLDWTGFAALGEREGFIVAYPEGLDQHWNDGRDDATRLGGARGADDVAFLAALIEHLVGVDRADPRRVYVAGVSNGGIMAHRAANELSDRIAAIAPVAGSLPEAYLPRFAPKAPVSVIAFHGTDDKAVLFGGGLVAGEGGGRTIPVRDTLARWAQADGCPPQPKQASLPDRDPGDGCRVRSETWGPGRDGTEVVLYVIEGGGHNWPGGPTPRRPILGQMTRDLQATPMIWEFFKGHPKPAHTPTPAGPAAPAPGVRSR